jgi:hypothetical protein
MLLNGHSKRNKSAQSMATYVWPTRLERVNSIAILHAYQAIACYHWPMNPTAQPNAEPELVSNFRFDRILSATSPLPERIAGCLRQSMDVLDRHTAPSAIRQLARLLELTDTQQESLLAMIVSIGHIGMLLPAGMSEAMLPEIIGTRGLAITASMPSRIFAKELAMLAGRRFVRTHIYRLEGVSRNGRPVCIELFVPKAEPALVNQWIANGVGTHVAFLTRSPEDVLAIRKMLKDREEFVPPFMQGQPMEGRAQGSLVIYYDLPVDAHGRKIRVEFYYEG